MDPQVLEPRKNTILEDFKKKKAIGKGISGKVFLYKVRKTGQKVAVKVNLYDNIV
jgi:hypothetical protein